LIPIAEDITNVEGGNSQEVGWFIGEETEDQPLIVYGILVLLIVLGTALFARKAASSRNYGDVPEFDEVDEN